MFICIVINARAESQQIIFGFPENPPFSTLDDNARCLGVLCDSLSELVESGLGYKLIFVTRPWRRIQLELKAGTIDLMLAVPTKERRDYAYVSQTPLYKLDMKIFARADDPRLQLIKQIKVIDGIKALNLVSITNSGNGWHKEKVQGRGVTTIFAGDDEQLILMLLAGRGDVIVDASLSMRYILSQLKVEEKVVELDAIMGAADIHVMLSKQSSYRHLMPEIDQLLLTKLPVLDAVVPD